MSEKPQSICTVGVIFGGQSQEHAISLQSATNIINNLHKKKYRVIPVGITKLGHWYIFPLPTVVSANSLNDLLTYPTPQAIPLFTRGQLTSHVKKFNLPIDVFFPAVHGPLCEDGALQGFLETLDLPYVGARVLSSAIAMDKGVAKDLVQQKGIDVVPYVIINYRTWQNNKDIYNTPLKELDFPVFVKPTNMGSSVGIHKVTTPSQLNQAIEDALQYDDSCLVEKAFAVREIEVSVLETSADNAAPLVSIPGEIIPNHEFYSYEAKYIDPNGARLEIPAKLTVQQQQEAQNLALKVFQSLRCNSMGRVDLFLTKDTGKFYFNELNTLPGFTSISMYPKLWEYSGVRYEDLLDHLLQLALQRHNFKQQLKKDFYHE